MYRAVYTCREETNCVEEIVFQPFLSSIITLFKLPADSLKLGSSPLASPGVDFYSFQTFSAASNEGCLLDEAHWHIPANGCDDPGATCQPATTDKRGALHYQVRVYL